jgi:hypothetical protein
LLSYSLAGISCPNSVRGWAHVAADSKMEVGEQLFMDQIVESITPRSASGNPAFFEKRRCSESNAIK